MSTDNNAKQNTRLIHAGRHPERHAGAVNVPPFRASTILFPDLASLEDYDPYYRSIRYGRTGNPSSHAFEEAVTVLEGGHGAVAYGSGVQAITSALLAFTKVGDHILMVDTAYGPSRSFCDGILKRAGVETEYYDPAISATDLKALLRPNTSVLFMESPGSQTFELQDVPALAAVTRDAGIVSMIDNTWAAGILFQPLAHGVDIAIQSATKYIGGHADASLGVAVTASEAHWLKLKKASVELGAVAGPDDLFMGLRGLRTLPTRMRQHHETGLILANWLTEQPEVTRMRHPALPGCPGHEIWQRDFSGACGLFAFEMNPVPKAALAAMVDGMRLFGMGYSWGGFESLILPCDPSRIRTATPWKGGQLIRIHVGLEDPTDLIADLNDGFNRLRKAQSQ